MRGKRRVRESPEQNERRLGIVWDKEQAHEEKIEAIEQDISSGLAIRRPKAVVINPDTLSYMILLAQIEEIGSYWMLEGKLSEMTRRDWPVRASEPVQHRNSLLLGGSWEQLVRGGEYCIDISGSVPRHSNMLHSVTPHILLYWKEQGEQYLGIASLDLGTWKVWRLKRKGDEFLGLETVGEPEIVSGKLDDRCDGVLDLLDRKKAELDQRAIRYTTM